MMLKKALCKLSDSDYTQRENMKVLVHAEIMLRQLSRCLAEEQAGSMFTSCKIDRFWNDGGTECLPGIAV